MRHMDEITCRPLPRWTDRGYAGPSVVAYAPTYDHHVWTWSGFGTALKFNVRCERCDMASFTAVRAADERITQESLDACWVEHQRSRPVIVLQPTAR
jgi:hypothetical protein